jgi:hypothetical protein
MNADHLSYVADWAKWFALTLLVELAVAVPLLSKHESLARRCGAVTLAQLASHPAVWFIFPALGLRHASYLVLVETWAIVSELLIYGLVFPRLAWLRALGISALANGASFALGTLIR